MLNKFKAWLEQPGTGCTNVEEIEKNSLSFLYIGENKSQRVTFEEREIICEGDFADRILRSWLKEAKEESELSFVVLGETYDMGDEIGVLFICPKDKIQKISSIEELSEFQELCVKKNLRVEVIQEVDKSFLLITETLGGNSIKVWIDSEKGQCNYEVVRSEVLNQKVAERMRTKVTGISNLLGIDETKAKELFTLISGRDRFGKGGSFLKNAIKNELAMTSSKFVMTDQQVVKISD